MAITLNFTVNYLGMIHRNGDEYGSIHMLGVYVHVLGLFVLVLVFVELRARALVPFVLNDIAR